MRRLLKLLVLASCLLPWPSPAKAYEKDTHFGLTYFLARSAGLPRDVAMKIAVADWSVDIEPNTQPARQPFSPDNQALWERFHAFRATRLPTQDDLPSRVYLVRELLSKGLVRRNFDSLWSYGLAHRNPGISLHFFQDVFAHAGYSSGEVGHAFPDVHAVDFLSNNMWTARDMAVETLGKIELFMHGTLGAETCPRDDARRAYLVERLIKVNPVGPLTVPDYAAALKPLAEVLPNESHMLTRPGLEGDDASARYRINPDGTVPDLPANTARGGGLYSDSFPIQIKPLDYLMGEAWRETKARSVANVTRKWPVYFAINSESKDENAVDFSGKHDWRFEAFTSGEWHFIRKPSADEIGKDVPKGWSESDWTWAKTEVAGKLEWHLFLRYEGCKLVGRFHPGLIRFKKKANGERMAEIPAGKAGWGTPRAVEFERDWPDIAGKTGN